MLAPSEWLLRRAELLSEPAPPLLSLMRAKVFVLVVLVVDVTGAAAALAAGAPVAGVPSAGSGGVPLSSVSTWCATKGAGLPTALAMVACSFAGSRLQLSVSGIFGGSCTAQGRHMISCTDAQQRSTACYTYKALERLKIYRFPPCEQQQLYSKLMRQMHTGQLSALETHRAVDDAGCAALAPATACLGLHVGPDSRSRPAQT